MALVTFACFYSEGTDCYINAEGNISSVISGAQSRSRHIFNVDVNSSDKLLTLSTCTRFYGNTDNQRFVVMARLLRPARRWANETSVRGSPGGGGRPAGAARRSMAAAGAARGSRPKGGLACGPA